MTLGRCGPRGPVVPHWFAQPRALLGAAFGPARRTFGHVQPLDVDGLVVLAGSYSYVALSPDRDQVLVELRELVARHPDLAGRRRFDLPYLSSCLRAERRRP